MGDLAHLEGSGLHMECPIQEILLSQCSVKMWAGIPHAYDMTFSWALWYGKRPRSLIGLDFAYGVRILRNC